MDKKKMALCTPIPEDKLDVINSCSLIPSV